MLRLLAASATDAGRIRASNQDRALVAPDLIAVADGMGGHAGGEVAAELAVEGLAGSFDLDTGLEGLIAAARRANRAIFLRSEAEEDLRGMGTTLTAAALVSNESPPRVHLINIGDSRAYLLDGDRLRQISEDHSFVEHLVRQGEITPLEALTHPHRHILTRAVGIEAEVDVDTFSLEALPGTRLLLASDGLTNELSDVEIASILLATPERDAAADALVRQAIAHGGGDNVTVVVADVVDDETALTQAVTDDGSAIALPTHAVASTGEAGIGVAPEVVREVFTAPSHVMRRPTPVRARSTPRSTHERVHQLEQLVTIRVVLFVLVLIALLGGIAGFTIWFNRGTYFVGEKDGYVAIFEGRPGGFLWFHPTLASQSTVKVSGILDASSSLLVAGILEPSYDSAQRVVDNLTNEATILGLPTTTSTTTTTTTTITTTTTVPKKTAKTATTVKG